MEIALGALMGLIGVIVGGFLQHFTSQRAIDRQHEWDRSRLVHEKLELIAQVANDMGQRMSNLYSGAIDSVETGESYKVDITLPFAKLEMLLSFYAPEIKHEYERLLVLRNEMGDIIVDLISGRVPIEKPNKQKLNGKLLKASFCAEKICESIINEASKLGRQHLVLKAEQTNALDRAKARLDWAVSLFNRFRS